MILNCKALYLFCIILYFSKAESVSYTGQHHQSMGSGGYGSTTQPQSHSYGSSAQIQSHSYGSSAQAQVQSHSYGSSAQAQYQPANQQHQGGLKSYSFLYFLIISSLSLEVSWIITIIIILKHIFSIWAVFFSKHSNILHESFVLKKKNFFDWFWMWFSVIFSIRFCTRDNVRFRDARNNMNLKDCFIYMIEPSVWVVCDNLFIDICGTEGSNELPNPTHLSSLLPISHLPRPSRNV